MLCLHNGIVVRHEKEWSPDTGYNMDTLENILLSEGGQATKSTYCVIPCMWNIQNRKIWRDWKQLCWPEGDGGGRRVTVNGFRASFCGGESQTVMVVQLHEYNGVAISFSGRSFPTGIEPTSPSLASYPLPLGKPIGLCHLWQLQKWKVIMGVKNCVLPNMWLRTTASIWKS